MGQPYVGEIRMFAGTYAPLNWSFCNGQTLQISEYTALYQLIGTTYGGDGVTTFNLPNLSSRVPLHFGSSHSGSYVLGQSAGTETVTLTPQQMPSHNHTVVGSSATSGQSSSPSGNTYGNSPSGQNVYSTASPSLAISPSTIASTGGSQPHPNIMPYQCISFIISLFGVFPTQG